MGENKAILTAAVLAATTLSAGVANADNVQTISSNNVQAKVSDKVTNADLNSARQNVSSAKASASSAQANVNSAQNKVNVDKQDVAGKKAAVDSAQANVSSAQESVDAAKQKVADASSKIPEIQSSIKKQESTINNDQTTIAHDKQNISSQQKNVDTAKQNVSSAQANVSAKQSAVSSAQANIKRDQQRIDDIHNAQAIASSAQSKVNTDKQDVTSKQSAKDNAQKAVDQASSNKSQADQTVNDANRALNYTQNKLNQDQSKLNDTQNELNNVTDEIESQPSVTLSKEYIDTLNKISTQLDSNSSAYKTLDAQLQKVGQQELNENSYTPSSTDGNEKIDINNLTYSQQEQLTLFAATLINQIRSNFGIPKVQVTDKAIQFAIDCAKQYSDDNWDPLAWHDVAGLVKVEKKWGLDTTDNVYYEDAGSLPMYGFDSSKKYSDGNPYCVMANPQTMADAKGDLYNIIMEMMFKDSTTNWAHAQDLAGITDGQRDTSSPYFGLSLGSLGEFHLETVPQSAILNGSELTQDAKAITTPDVGALKQQQASLQSQISDEKGAVNADKQAVSNAQNALNAAKSIQTQANNDLASKQTALANANDALQQAQSQLSKDEATLAQAQKDIANAPAELQAANTQLAKDNQTLTNAKNALTTANTQLTNAKNVQAQDEVKLNDLNNQLSRDEQRLANDQSILAQLQKQLADYQNAPAELKEAQAQLADAQSKLAQAKNALASSQATLNADQKVLADAQAKLNDAQVAETQAEKHLADLQNAYDAQHKVTEPQTSRRVLTTAEIGSTYTLGSHTISEPDVLSATVKASNKNIVHADTVTAIKTAKMNDKTASAADMPQAGESSSSVASIIGAGLLAALSFLGLGYKKEEK